MARFVFKLHAVLRQRELLEQERQRELAVVQAEKVAIEAELRRLEQTVEAAVTDLRTNQLIGKLNLSFLAAHRRFMLAMQRQGVAQLQKVNEATQKVEAARLRLAEAAKQTKIIEKLKERQQAAWQEALNRKETAALDEIAMQMTTMSMMEQWTENGTDNVANDKVETGF